MINNSIALRGKRILFLCPRFFGYEKSLKNEMERLGAEVKYYDERPSNTVLKKALLRINRNLINRSVQKYYQNIIDQIRDDEFDIVLVCQGEATPVGFLKKIRKIQKHARIIFYLWDSVENKVNTLEKVPFFDRVYSFDVNDCKKYNWDFRPLFFDNIYESSSANDELTTDLFFVGTIHSDRYKILKKIQDWCNKTGKTVFFYFYLPTKLMFFYLKYIQKNLKGAVPAEFHYEGLPAKTLNQQLRQARAVVDIQHPAQIGLTMRTIEMIGASKKLITTNADVKNYDFYNPNNILVIDRNRVEIPEDFLNMPYKSIPEEIYNKYTISYFILNLTEQIPVRDGDFYEF